MARTGSGVDIRENSIRITFSFEGKQHRPTLMIGERPMPPTPANIKHAIRLVAEIRQKIKLELFSMAEYFPAIAGDVAGIATVALQLDNWLASQRIEGSTKAGYQSAINFWKAAPADDKGTPLGTKPLRALLTSHVLRALASRPNISGKTVNNYVSVLREAIDMAVTDKLLQRNPVEDVKRAKHQKEPPDPFTHEESAAIIASFHAKHPGQVANFVEAWFWTGMRTSEIFALRWDNVDLASGHAVVKEALVRGELKERTKTNTVRTILLNSWALGAVQRQRAHTQMSGTAVFMDPRYGMPWSDERAFRRSYWTPLLRKLGIRYRRPYQMRHSYATAMLMAGMRPAFCAKQLGHSVEVFLHTYSKWIDGEQNDVEMQRLENAFGKPAAPAVALPEVKK